MKRFVLLLTAILFTLLPLNIKAVPKETDDGILYTVEEGSVTVVGFNYAGTTLDIPEEIDGYPVKYIGAQACRGNEAIAELYIPRSVESIGEFAFAECKNLKKAVIRGSKTVGFSAFKGCSSLKRLKLSENYVSIDDSAFEGCIMLGEVTIPSSIEKIGYDTFLGCHRLRFNAKNNSYAKQYAKANSIPTSFFETWDFTVILLISSCVGVIAVYFIAKRLLKKKK